MTHHHRETHAVRPRFTRTMSLMLPSWTVICGRSTNDKPNGCRWDANQPSISKRAFFAAFNAASIPSREYRVAVFDVEKRAHRCLEWAKSWGLLDDEGEPLIMTSDRRRRLKSPVVPIECGFRSNRSPTEFRPSSSSRAGSFISVLLRGTPLSPTPNSGQPKIREFRGAEKNNGKRHA